MKKENLCKFAYCEPVALRGMRRNNDTNIFHDYLDENEYFDWPFLNDIYVI